MQQQQIVKSEIVSLNTSFADSLARHCRETAFSDPETRPLMAERFMFNE
ncbi:MAG: hypothetical protein FD167_5902, partial [bacterium]